jgi:hypothetical protein
MRTTLDIDDDVLVAVKELAKAQKSTAGEVISALARKALTQDATAADTAAPHGLLYEEGWYVMPSRGGIVTNELVDKIQEELDRDDARLAGRQRAPGADG